MTVLVVQNDKNSGPENILGWLEDNGLRYHLAEPFLTGELKFRGLENYTGVVVCGGFQNAYPDDQGHYDSPWLPYLKALARRATETDTPYLGICLGAQILAEATGGRVAPAVSGPEIGLKKVDLSLGLLSNSSFFHDLPAVVDVAMWHDSEVHYLPMSAELLASNGHSKVQAFSVGNSLGTQFHWEYSYDKFVWRIDHYSETVQRLGVNPQEMLNNAKNTFKSVYSTGETIIRNFSGLVYNYGEGKTHG